MTAENLTAHPAAEIFPRMSEREFQQLKDDIDVNGQRQPIIKCDGQILDGRHRYRACTELGVEPRCEEYAGNDPLGFVIGANVLRRHLSTSQRAMSAAKASDSKHGGNRSKPQICGLTHAGVATIFNVSKRSVETASKLLKAAREGRVDDAVVKAVEEGKLSLNAAYQLSKKQTQGTNSSAGRKRHRLLKAPDLVFSDINSFCEELANQAEMDKERAAPEHLRLIVDGCRRGAKQLGQMADLLEQKYLQGGNTPPPVAKPAAQDDVFLD